MLLRPTARLCKSSASASSSRWLARQSKDPYVKLRSNDPSSGSTGTGGYRSRSSFKLISLANKYPILGKRTKSVVDLGAAPGGWSQVALNLLTQHQNKDKRDEGGGKMKIVAVDILGMDDIPGLHILQGNFLDPHIQDKVKELTSSSQDEHENGGRGKGGGVDTVLSDMMAPMTGNRTRDISLSLELCEIATYFARSVLKIGLVHKEGNGEQIKGKRKVYSGGSLVLKFFAHPDFNEFKKVELDPWFEKVFIDKPKESRSESSEAYFVCLGFKGDPLNR